MEEFVDGIRRALPTGLDIIAIIVKGGTPKNYKGDLPCITSDLAEVKQKAVDTILCHGLIELD
jgi:hypothetical protein